MSNTNINEYLIDADRWFGSGESGRGGFVTNLYKLCGVADNANVERLLVAFPGAVGAWIVRYYAGAKVMEDISDDRPWQVKREEGGGFIVSRLSSRVDLDEKPCMTVTRFGTEPEPINFRQFAEDVVQEWGVAYDVAEDQLLDGDGWHSWNHEDPEAYERFDVTDKDELRRQIDHYKAEE